LWLTIIVLLLAPIALLVCLRVFPTLDLSWFSAQGHLLAVSAIAVCALAAAATALVTARRSGQPNATWLGIGCVAVGLFMLGHGLTTPGVFGRPMNDWVGRLPFLGMCVFAVCLFGAGRSTTWWLNRFIGRHPSLSIAVPTGAITALVVAVSINPLALGGGRPYSWEENMFDVVATLAVGLLLVVIRRHWMRWHLGYDVVQFAIVLAAASAIAALFAFEHGKFGQVSWWDYHGFLIAGFGGAVYAVFRGRSNERTLTDILGAAFVDDPFHQIVSGYPEELRSLVRAVEVKDAYTHGHSQRTARLSVELGLSMGLSSDRLRVIARGAYLHDVGKIGIPDAILNKPGKLTTDEWAVIHSHPQLGYDLAATAPSLKEALPVILHHHERVDGGGYPKGLVGDNIPLEARVVAVADVWDALTSDRAYRRGWAPEMALSHILAGSGTHFDPIVVLAFTRLVGGWGVRSGQPGGAATIAWQAAETCHEVDLEEPALV
jgi:HD-GYP domain-containing protein (c-di-GMP phosphodiesterase class II)